MSRSPTLTRTGRCRRTRSGSSRGHDTAPSRHSPAAAISTSIAANRCVMNGSFQAAWCASAGRKRLFERGGARHGFGVRSGGPVALDTGCASEQLVEEPRAYGGRYDDSVRAARCCGRCVERHRDGRVAHVVTVDESAAACPGCGVFSTSVKQCRVTRPRDLGYGEEPLAVRWHKRQFRCRERGCSRRAFTESIAELPPGARVTGRLRRAAGAAVDEHGSVRAAAAGHGISWPVVHAAFVGHADAQLVEPAPVAVLGIDETRRGRPRWDRDPDSGGGGGWTGSRPTSWTWAATVGCSARPAGAPLPQSLRGWTRAARTGRRRCGSWR